MATRAEAMARAARLGRRAQRGERGREGDEARVVAHLRRDRRGNGDGDEPALAACGQRAHRLVGRGLGLDVVAQPLVRGGLDLAQRAPELALRAAANPLAGASRAALKSLPPRACSAAAEVVPARLPGLPALFEMLQPGPPDRSSRRAPASPRPAGERGGDRPR